MPRALLIPARYLAPLLLCVIAVVQIYRAHAFDQSPWKGGGFGMFSTADSPGARYVRAFLISEGGEELEVPLPTLAEATLERVRVIPQAAPLEEVAELIVTTRWVWAEYDPVPRLIGEEARAVPPAAVGAPDGGDAEPEPDAPAPGGRRLSRPADQPRLRPLQGGEPTPPPEAMVPVDAARVELWKLRFDGETNRLSTRRLLAVTHEAGERIPGKGDAGGG